MAEKKIIAVVGATGAQGGGLVRAILADREGPFVARAITRKPESEKARALASLGVEVVAGDADDPASLDRAFAGAHGAFCVTNFWEHLSAEREGPKRRPWLGQVERPASSTSSGRRSKTPASGCPSTMPGCRRFRASTRCPTSTARAPWITFSPRRRPTTYLLASFYWENFLYFGMGPRKAPNGDLVLALPLGGIKLPGIATEDIGKCAYGLFRRGTSTVGQRFGIAGEVLSGPEMAAAMARALGRKVASTTCRSMSTAAWASPGRTISATCFSSRRFLETSSSAVATPSFRVP